MDQPVLLETDGLIATLTINRPNARNAMSIEILDAMHKAIDELAATSTASVLILTGAGKAFCAGMDLKAVLIELSGDASVGEELLTSLARLTLKIRNLHQVVVASVNGAAIGGGCGLTCVCDVTVSHKDATLGFPEVDLGICPAVIAPWVVKKLGAGRARKAMLMGGVMRGTEAFDIGLVDHLAEDRNGLDELTRTLASRLATGGPKALSATKKLLNELDGSIEETMVLKGAKLSASVLATPEAQKALASRLKR